MYELLDFLFTELTAMELFAFMMAGAAVIALLVLAIGGIYYWLKGLVRRIK